MRIYIAGPMTGLPDLNFPAFNAKAAELRALGHEVVNPAEIQSDGKQTWEWYMRKDIQQMMDCDAIFLLPRWIKSRGARLERTIAMELSFTILQ